MHNVVFLYHRWFLSLSCLSFLSNLLSVCLSICRPACLYIAVLWTVCPWCSLYLSSCQAGRAEVKKKQKALIYSVYARTKCPHGGHKGLRKRIRLFCSDPVSKKLEFEHGYSECRIRIQSPSEISANEILPSIINRFFFRVGNMTLSV